MYGIKYTKSFPCPVGYYCESGDTIPTPCPNKTYNPSERGSRKENCLPCQIDHYNHLTGQSACFHCGGQAKQPYLGQDKCQCNGLHRVFMVSDFAVCAIHDINIRMLECCSVFSIAADDSSYHRLAYTLARFCLSNFSLISHLRGNNHLIMMI
jgi:hypothetical protein